jgi:hypothetical protein
MKTVVPALLACAFLLSVSAGCEKLGLGGGDKVVDTGAPAAPTAPAAKTLEEFSKVYAETQCALAKESNATKHDEVRLSVLTKYGYDLKAFVDDKAKYGTALGEQLKTSCMPASALDPSIKVKYLDLAVKLGCAEKTIRDGFRLQAERDRLFKEYGLAPEDLGRVVEKLKVEDRDFSDRLRQGIETCAAPGTVPAQPPVGQPPVAQPPTAQPPVANPPPANPPEDVVPTNDDVVVLDAKPVSADGTYRDNVTANGMGGILTFTVRGAHASGNLTIGGRSFLMSGTYRGRKVGLSGRAQNDFAKVESVFNPEKRVVSGSIEGAVRGRQFYTRFSANRK